MIVNKSNCVNDVPEQPTILPFSDNDTDSIVPVLVIILPFLLTMSERLPTVAGINVSVTQPSSPLHITVPLLVIQVNTNLSPGHATG